MQVLAIVHRNVADRAQAELIAVKLELEDECRQVVSLEFQLAGKQKKLGEAQRACAVAIERHEESMTNNEELCAQQIKEKKEADVKISRLQKELEDERAKAMEERASLQKELEEERAKTASEKASLQKELEEERTKASSERAAYPDLYVAAIEQFKGSAEFQIAIDAAVASSVAREVSGEAGSSGTAAGGRTEAGNY
ncbi:inner centromere protein-like [Camellia sinensis]|uniref:inner centromere protein-like n=1 Tax=Camellia sinensis TaxID=4442 RepID=UPI001036860E|nr:inner centromere protein-like [Camellia sinensis]